MDVLNYSLLQRPEAPHGKTKPVFFTGSPISSDSTCPPKGLTISVEIIYVRTAGASPVVYELTKKNNGLSERRFEQSLMKL